MKKLLPLGRTTFSANDNATRPGQGETRMIAIGFASIGSVFVGGLLAASHARITWRVLGTALMFLGLALGCVYGPMP